MILKEAVVTYFKVLYQNLPGGAEENQKASGRIVDLRVGIWTRDPEYEGGESSRPEMFGVLC